MLESWLTSFTVGENTVNAYYVNALSAAEDIKVYDLGDIPNRNLDVSYVDRVCSGHTKRIGFEFADDTAEELVGISGVLQGI